MYTSVVVDLIDTENQRITWDNLMPIDRVSGYTIRQIEQGINGATSWNAWRNNMINRHSNPTSGMMNELFANWRN